MSMPNEYMNNFPNCPIKNVTRTYYTPPTNQSQATALPAPSAPPALWDEVSALRLSVSGLTFRQWRF